MEKEIIGYQDYTKAIIKGLTCDGLVLCNITGSRKVEVINENGDKELVNINLFDKDVSVENGKFFTVTKDDLAQLVLNDSTINNERAIEDTVYTNIESGVTNKDFTLPAGYIISNVLIKSQTKLTNITITNTTNNTKIIYNEVCDSLETKYFYTSNQTSLNTDSIIRLNAIGNTSNFTIVINIKKIY